MAEAAEVAQLLVAHYPTWLKKRFDVQQLDQATLDKVLAHLAQAKACISHLLRLAGRLETLDCALCSASQPPGSWAPLFFELYRRADADDYAAAFDELSVTLEHEWFARMDALPSFARPYAEIR